MSIRLFEPFRVDFLGMELESAHEYANPAFYLGLAGGGEVIKPVPVDID